MVPLMLEKDYRATGWLGLLMGTRVYFNFYPEVVKTDAAFKKQMDALVRELGTRGQPAGSGYRVSFRVERAGKYFFEWRDPRDEQGGDRREFRSLLRQS